MNKHAFQLVIVTTWMVAFVAAGALGMNLYTKHTAPTYEDYGRHFRPFLSFEPGPGFLKAKVMLVGKQLNDVTELAEDGAYWKEQAEENRARWKTALDALMKARALNDELMDAIKLMEEAKRDTQ